MRSTIIGLNLTLLFLAGCAVTDEPHLRAEVASLVKPGDFTNLAMAKLELAKFVCTTDGPNDIDCTRDRYTKIIATCVQQVKLLGARTNGRVRWIDVGPVRCLGGFG